MRCKANNSRVAALKPPLPCPTGAGRVVATGPNQQVLSTLHELGADATIHLDAPAEDLGEEFMREAGDSGFQVAIDLRVGPPRRSISGCGKVGWSGVGRGIREVRGLDMTQADFAARVGISQNYLSMMERGQVEIGARSCCGLPASSGKLRNGCSRGNNYRASGPRERKKPRVSGPGGCDLLPRNNGDS